MLELREMVDVSVTEFFGRFGIDISLGLGCQEVHASDPLQVRR